MDAGKKERLRDLMEEAGVRSWARDYQPDDIVLDGWGWALTIRFKNGKVLASEGKNAWPETLGFFWEGLFDIVGIKVPSGDDKPEWVCHLVGKIVKGNILPTDRQSQPRDGLRGATPNEPQALRRR